VRRRRWSPAESGYSTAVCEVLSAAVTAGPRGRRPARAVPKPPGRRHLHDRRFGTRSRSSTAWSASTTVIIHCGPSYRPGGVSDHRISRIPG